MFLPNFCTVAITASSIQTQNDCTMIGKKRNWIWIAIDLHKRNYNIRYYWNLTVQLKLKKKQFYKAGECKTKTLNNYKDTYKDSVKRRIKPGKTRKHGARNNCCEHVFPQCFPVLPQGNMFLP